MNRDETRRDEANPTTDDDDDNDNDEDIATMLPNRPNALLFLPPAGNRTRENSAVALALRASGSEPGEENGFVSAGCCVRSSYR